MKIKEFLEIVENAYAKHGDVDVFIYSGGDNAGYFELKREYIEVLEDEKQKPQTIFKIGIDG